MNIDTAEALHIFHRTRRAAGYRDPLVWSAFSGSGLGATGVELLLEAGLVEVLGGGSVGPLIRPAPAAVPYLAPTGRYAKAVVELDLVSGLTVVTLEPYQWVRFLRDGRVAEVGDISGMELRHVVRQLELGRFPSWRRPSTSRFD